MKARADDDGLHLDARITGSYDVLFDGRAIWSFTVKRSGAGERLVRWPDAMRPWLDGTAVLGLRDSGDEDAEVLEVGESSFGSGRGRVEFVDKQGVPVVIDKWGIVQRPFSARGGDVAAQVAEAAERVIDALREELGLEAWIAFGTLLGAARTGHVIGHDSDVDLLYLSEEPTPAGINLEAYRIKRALARRGFRCLLKTGSFITVLVPGLDGAPLGIDVYACFYVDDLLHETATVRAPIPREAILPLTTMTFEGRELPAPARAEALLEASYGPGWRVPDPSFRHTPGPEIISRFEGWFGNLMTNRRAWELWWREHPEPAAASPLAHRVVEEVTARKRRKGGVVELGAGNGADALHLARHGVRVFATEYARGCFKQAQVTAKKEKLDAVFRQANLYDLRDVLSLAALLRHRGRPPAAVLARGVLECLQPRGREAFWRFCALALRNGGRIYLEVDELDAAAAAEGLPGTGSEEGPRRYPLAVADVRADAVAIGARVVADEPAGTPAGRVLVLELPRRRS